MDELDLMDLKLHDNTERMNWTGLTFRRFTVTNGVLVLFSFDNEKELNYNEAVTLQTARLVQDGLWPE